jgi:hypothetical protein
VTSRDVDRDRRLALRDVRLEVAVVSIETDVEDADGHRDGGETGNGAPEHFGEDGSSSVNADQDGTIGVGGRLEDLV